MYPKVVVCGAGFLGSRIAARLLNSTTTPLRRVQLLSRNPDAEHAALADSLLSPHNRRLEPPVNADITDPDSLAPGMRDADVVVSLVGIMHGTPAEFERVQWKGAENVAKAAQAVGAKLIHVSAIGANAESSIPYARTKALGEQAVLAACPNATIVRPSILFGPGDGFFTRFAKLSKVLPFLPVFGGGRTLFQPVLVEDVAQLVEILSRQDPKMRQSIDGMTIEAGGPDILTYRQIMDLVLEYSERWRPVVSVPYAIGTLQGLVLEQLPLNLFTLTRAQVEQLKEDNIVDQSLVKEGWTFAEILEKYSSSTPTSVHEVLPSYLPYV